MRKGWVVWLLQWSGGIAVSRVDGGVEVLG